MSKKSRLPPGQRWINGFPVRTAEPMPEPFNPETWNLTVDGEVKTPLVFSYNEFRALPVTTQISDFHCVEGWSVPDNKWEGVAFKKITKLAKPKPNAKFVTIECYGGYSTSLPLEELMNEDVLFAYKHEDRELEPVHGGPVRLVVPKKYAYKSAKWVHKVKFTKTQELGFWEKRGYSNTADPWKEERYSHY